MLTTNQIFISGTTAGLESYRKVVKDALIDRRWLPVEQSHFGPDHRSIEDMLRSKIAECDAVVCLIGPVFGAASAIQGPDGGPRSYTQLEYDIAMELGKKIYLFLAREDAALDEHAVEPEEHRLAQAAFQLSIRSGTRLIKEFSDHNALHKQALLLPMASAQQGRKPIKLPGGDGLFVGREKLIDEIRDRFQRHIDDERAKRGKLPVQVLNGTSGIGKTRLAIEYGHKFEDSYSALLFISADSEQQLNSELASLVGVLYHENAPERTNPQEATRLASVLRWLSEHPGWLLIMDNVDDTSTARKVEELLDEMRDGHVIITSRISGWRRGVQPLELGVIDEEEAVRYLLEDTLDDRIQRPDDASAARVLVKECDGLALVLEQMSAYIRRHGIGFDEYLSYWREDKPRLLDFGGDPSMFHKKSLAHSWSIAMERSEKHLREMAQVLAWFHPEALPCEIFRTDAAREAFSGLPHWSATSGGTVARPEDVLMDVADHCFLRRLTAFDQPCVTQHRLMQEVARIHTSTDDRSEHLKCATKVLVAAIPEGSFRFDHASTWRWLRPHAFTLLAHGREWLPGNERSPLLLQGLCEHLLEQHDAEEGLGLQQELLAWHEEHSGPDDPQTHLAHNDLANFLMQLGRAEEAEKHAILALRGREKHFGSTSTEAGESLTVLGQVLSAEGRYAEAEEVLVQAIGACRVSDGVDHWRTLMAENSLLNARWQQGERSSVVDGMRSLLERTRRSLPEGHREILERELGLADRLWRTGRLQEARSLALDHLSASERILGKDDRQSLHGLVLLFHIARSFHESGDPGEAATLYAEVIDRFDANQQEQLKGLPREVLRRMYALAMAGVDDERVVEASWACLSALERDLGENDQQVLMLVRHMADIMERRSDGAAAIRLRRRALTHSAKQASQGGNAAHSYAIDLNNLAHALRVSGDPEAAEPYQREALDLDIRIRGADHPKVAHRSMNLAINHIMRGQIREANTMLANAWAIFGGKPDVTGCRVLLLRTMTQWLSGQDASEQLGMLRTALSNPCTNKAAVDIAWDVSYFIDRMGPTLTPDQHSLLEECLAAMKLPFEQRTEQSMRTLVRYPLQPLDRPLG
ncbi:MAG: tetratricopeptide repeat protein [Flavobacteriales bacterium]|nr:tetratricopeptide repeat protein [Flavobacteriales bacterium]